MRAKFGRGCHLARRIVGGHLLPLYPTRTRAQRCTSLPLLPSDLSGWRCWWWSEGLLDGCAGQCAPAAAHHRPAQIDHLSVDRCRRQRRTSHSRWAAAMSHRTTHRPSPWTGAGRPDSLGANGGRGFKAHRRNGGRAKPPVVSATPFAPPQTSALQQPRITTPLPHAHHSVTPVREML